MATMTCVFRVVQRRNFVDFFLLSGYMMATCLRGPSRARLFSDPGWTGNSVTSFVCGPNK